MNPKPKSKSAYRVSGTLNELVGRVVWLICSHKGCPRKLKITGEALQDLPKRVAYVVSPCPWHEGSPGDYTSEEWYDKNHKQVLEAANNMLTVSGVDIKNKA